MGPIFRPTSADSALSDLFRFEQAVIRLTEYLTVWRILQVVLIVVDGQTDVPDHLPLAYDVGHRAEATLRREIAIELRQAPPTV